MGDEAHEREIENGSIRHVNGFLLELGAGLAFVGRQLRPVAECALLGIDEPIGAAGYQLLCELPGNPGHGLPGSMIRS